MLPDNLNEHLMHAVTYHKVAEVNNYLERGADPNYNSYVDKSPEEERGQPSTPLRMVMFCISDSLLDDHGLRDFAAIAKLLIKYGADPKPAMEIAESRYGKYDPTAESTPFMDTWKVIVSASKS